MPDPCPPPASSTPSLTFALAVFVYGEAFTRVHALTFGCIWLALLLTTLDGLRSAGPALQKAHA